MAMRAHNTRVFVDDDTYADMEEVRAVLTRGLRRKVSNRVLISVAMKFMKEGARNGSLQPFLTRVKVDAPKYENY